MSHVLRALQHAGSSYEMDEAAYKELLSTASQMERLAECIAEFEPSSSGPIGVTVASAMDEETYRQELYAIAQNVLWETRVEASRRARIELAIRCQSDTEESQAAA